VRPQFRPQSRELQPQHSQPQQDNSRHGKPERVGKEKHDRN
jgi:hypothetical protein